MDFRRKVKVLLLLLCLTVCLNLITIFICMDKTATTTTVSSATVPGLRHAVSLTTTARRRQKNELRRLLFYLNLTEDEAPRHLARTLDAPLLLNNPDLCRTKDGSEVHVLFMVHTAPDHFQRRHDMRTTFMAPSNVLFLNANVRGVFLLGRVSTNAEQQRLEAEHDQHGDLVQGDFLDSYHNLSHKGVMGYGWVERHCPRVKVLVKLDDDMFFDTVKLLQHYWPVLQNKRRSVMCNLSKSHAKSAVIYRAGKWTVDRRLFRNETHYPYHYCTGNMVIVTGDLVPSLFDAARLAPLFWVDDVYLYGILPVIATNVSFYFAGYGNQVMQRNPDKAQQCLNTKKHDCPMLAAIAEGEQLHALWNATSILHTLNKGLRVVAQV